MKPSPMQLSIGVKSAVRVVVTIRQRVLRLREPGSPGAVQPNRWPTDSSDEALLQISMRLLVLCPSVPASVSPQALDAGT